MRCQQKHELLHMNLKFSSLIHSSWKMTKGKRSLDIWLRTRTIPGTFNSSLYTNVLRGASWGRMILKQHPRRQQKLLCTEAYKLSSVGSWSLAACHPVGKKTRWQSLMSHLALSSLRHTFQVARFLSKTSVGLVALPGAGAHGCRKKPSGWV